MEAKPWKQSRGSEGGQGDIGNLAIHNHASTCSAVLVGSVTAGGFSGPHYEREPFVTIGSKPNNASR